MSAMRRSVLIRLGARSSAGGANGSCASLSPGDAAAIAEGKPVRRAVMTNSGHAMELTWDLRARRLARRERRDNRDRRGAAAREDGEDREGGEVMYLLSAAAVLLAVLAPRPARPVPVRHPSRAEVVAARDSPSSPRRAPSRRRAPHLRPFASRRRSRPPRRAGLRAVVAVQLESLPICRRAGGPEGPGLAEVTYRPDGTASISLSRNYAGSSVGACVARRFGNAARPFDGEPVTIVASPCDPPSARLGLRQRRFSADPAPRHQKRIISCQSSMRTRVSGDLRATG